MISNLVKIVNKINKEENLYFRLNLRDSSEMGVLNLELIDIIILNKLGIQQILTTSMSKVRIIKSVCK